MKRYIKPLAILLLSTLFLFPSVASFYYLLLRSPIWRSRIISSPQLETLSKTFWPLPNSLHQFISNLLAAFEQSNGLLYLWLSVVLCLLLLLRTEPWKKLQSWLFRSGDLKQGMMLLLPLIPLWWVFDRVSPQLGVLRQSMLFGPFICLFLDIPLIALVAVLHQGLKKDRWRSAITIGWSTSWRKAILWTLYSVAIIPFMLILTYVWVAPTTVLTKAINEQPEIIKNGPLWLSTIFEQYLDLVWLLLAGSFLVVIYLIPALLLSKAYTLALSRHKEKEEKQ